MATPAQSTNLNNGVYKDAQNNVFKNDGTPVDLPTFKSLGLNIDHINLGGAQTGTTSATQPMTQTQAQPTGAPQTGLSKVATQGVGPDGKPIYDIFAGSEHIADPNDPRLQGVNLTTLPEGQAPAGFQSKFQQGFNDANSKLGANGMNVDGATGNSLVNQYSPSKKNDFSSMFVQNDETLNNLVSTFQDFINPANQRQSLRDTYDQMLKDTGIQAIDMELVDMKKVIEGSEDDLRTEITKAGGFATESQVQALTNARNKQLIKNYNTLLDTRNSKEKYLTTAIGLEQADRQSADQRFESAFSMGTQIAQLQQQMQTNARSQMQWLTENMGFDGLYDATGGDPYTMSLVEQTLGLPQGGLASAARQAETVKLQAEQERQLALQEQGLGIQLKQEQLKALPLDRQLKQEQIKTEQAQRAKIYADVQKITDANKGSILDPNTPAGAKQLAFNKSQVDQINNILTSGNLNTAVGPNVFSRYGSLRNIFRPGSANFIADVEQLRSQLSLESLVNAKERGATFGALSEGELRLLESSGSKLSQWAVTDSSGKVTGYKTTEADFKRELDKINNFAKLDYVYRGGSPEDVGVQVLNGKYYTLNSDGSVTEL